MKPMYYPIFLFLVGCGLFVGFSAAHNNQTCTAGTVNYPPVDDLDIPRLVQKRWYVQEVFTLDPKYATTDPPPYECYVQLVGGFYVPPIGGLTHMFGEIITEVGSTNAYIMNAGPTLNSSAVWVIMSNTGITMYTTVFTATDYKTFGVMHWCSDIVGPGYYEKVMTFTGVPDPEESLVAELKGRVAAMGFPTNYSVRVPHHEDCNYMDYEYYYADSSGNKVAVADNIDFEA